MTSGGYAAIVLAGDRGPSDPIAAATGAPCKALSPVGGTPLLERIIQTLRGMPQIDSIAVVGPAGEIVAAEPQLALVLSAPDVTWIAPAQSPSASAVRALAGLADHQPALLTTADHALLAPTMIEALLAVDDSDLSVGLVEYACVKNAYPQSRRTTIRLGPGDGYCGCNLFAIHSQAARRLVADWQRVERQRKHPGLVVAGMLGGIGIIRYALGTLTLDDAFARLSRRMRLEVRPVLLREPEAAIDVDSLADLELVESILAGRTAAQRKR